MLADWIVIPRSRSAGRKSVVVLPVSTVPGLERYPDVDRIDSVKVVLPESVNMSIKLTCATFKISERTYVRDERKVSRL